jgi:hypothetical protein
MSDVQSEKEEKERKEIYAKTRDDLLARNLSNSEKYDNAILTLSTGILGLSVAFIKDIIPLGKAKYIFLLESTWWLFGSSIVVVLCSFFVSQMAIKKQLNYAVKYYLDKEDEYLKKKNLPAILTEYINWVAGGLFIFGIIATIIFVSANTQGGANMAKGRNINEGATIPALQKIQTNTDLGKGQTVPALEPVKTISTPPQQPSGSQTQAPKTNKK